MKEIEDEKLREVIIKTMSDWIYTISGKSVTIEKLKEIEEIANQVIRGRGKKIKNQNKNENR